MTAVTTAGDVEAWRDEARAAVARILRTVRERGRGGVWPTRIMRRKTTR